MARDYLKYKDYYDNYDANYRKVNAGKRRDTLKKYYKMLRDKTFDLLGNECKKCGFDDPRALQVDHINGGGHKETQAVKGFYPKFILDELLGGSKKYQLLCANCNWIKRAENKEVTIKRIYN